MHYRKLQTYVPPVGIVSKKRKKQQSINQSEAHSFTSLQPDLFNLSSPLSVALHIQPLSPQNALSKDAKMNGKSTMFILVIKQVTSTPEIEKEKTGKS